MTVETERRFTTGTVELRAAEGGGKRIGGYALKFNKLSRNLGGFVERVATGAVTKTIADGGDVLARYHHDDRMLLGRTLAQTLRLTIDDVGLDYDTDLPDTSYARDLEALAARGDVRHSSFAFQVMPDGDEWTLSEQGFPLRTLKEIRLVDVAPVVNPAYPDATSGLRSLAETVHRSLDEVREVANANRLAELLKNPATVIDMKPPADDEPGDTRSFVAVRLALAEGPPVFPQHL